MVAPKQENSLKKKTAFIGNYGTDISAGVTNEEYLTELQGTDAAFAFDKMRTQDPIIRMALGAVLNPLKSANWEVQPASDDESDKNLAEFVDFILFCDIIRGWQSFLNEALTFVAFGHSVFEIINKNVKNHPRWGDYTGVHSLSFRSQKTLEEFNVDRITGELTNIRQRTQGDLNNDIVIPAEFLLLFIMDLEGADYASTQKSLLRPCYGPWFRKQNYLRMETIGHEKHTVGTPIGTVPSNLEDSSEVDNFKTVLSNYSYHQKQFIVLPEGFTLDIKFGNFDGAKLRATIDGENQEIVRGFMANFLNLGQAGSGGAYALGADLSDFFLKSIQYIGDIIVDVINGRLIPHIVDLNFGEQEFYPTLNFSGIDDVGLEFANTISALITSGALTSDNELEAHIRRRLKLPEKPESTDPLITPTTVIPRATPTTPDTPIQAPRPAENERDAATDTQVSMVARETQSIDMQDTSPRGMITKGSQGLAETMVINLDTMSNKLITDIINRFNNLPDASKQNATKNIKVGGMNRYKKDLRSSLGNLAAMSTNQALEDIGLKTIRFQDPLGLNEDEFTNAQFRKLPKQTRDKINRIVDDTVDGQASDLEMNAFRQFSNSIDTSRDPAILASDMKEKTDKVISAAKGVAAITIASQLVNFSRQSTFVSDEGRAKVGSFTFFNPAPVSQICTELAGRVFSINDAESFRNTPPLHFNCKSVLIPNLVDTAADSRAQKIIDSGNQNGRLTNVTQKAEQSINLADCQGIGFELADLILDRVVQTIIFDRKIWSEDDSRSFLAEHNMNPIVFEKADQFFYARIHSALLFKEGSLFRKKRARALKPSSERLWT
jgi:hypothetical protein